ncbi:MAG TPA: IS66 family transposase [Acidobacteriota bacterium]|nr:IS66 family transposase [Acidobacteriota bacterium]
MSELQAAHARIAALEEQVAQLELLIEWFKKQMFGAGKSERADMLQLQLKLKELEAARDELVNRERISYEREKPKVRTVPAERFEGLPVKETVVVEPAEVQNDPDLYERIGEEETFEVDITPPKLYKRAIIRPKYRHRLERSRPPVVAPAPKRVIEGSYASAGLITWVILSKYRDHLPLHRQEGMLKRWGGPVPKQTMSDWVATASFLLEVIYWKIREGLLGVGYLQADETPIKFIDPDIKKGKAQTGYFWLMGVPDGPVFIQWSQGRGQAHAGELLAGFRGILQTDGYAGYNPVHGEDTPVTRVACLAHCRRKFAEALKAAPVQAAFMLRLIGNLYHLDNQWERNGITDPAQRAHLRQRDFAMTLRLLEKAAIRLLKSHRPTTAIGKACSYLLGQWDALIRLCDYGQVKLDNNLIENAVRPTKLGAKNWLFIGAPHAGKRSAIIYTILLSCQRCGVDPQAYLQDLLQKLPHMSNQDDFTHLLPQNWKPPVTHNVINGHKQGTQYVTIDV